MTLTPSESLQHLHLAVELSGIDAGDVVLPDTQHLVVQGTRLHNLDWGTRGRPPVLFLHGVALDQRGHGDSEWSPIMDYGPEAHGRDIDGVLDALRFERVVLVGQSMGGLNAFVYAAQHPERVAALVLVDVGPEIRMAGARRIGTFVTNTAELDSIDAFVEQALAFNPLRDRRLLTGSVRQNVRQLSNGKWVRKNDTRIVGQGGLEEFARKLEAYWRDVDRVTCPTLVVRGALSDVFLDDAAERFARQLPDGSWIRIERAGHTVQGDNPAGLIAALRTFLSDTRAAPAA